MDNDEPGTSGQEKAVEVTSTKTKTNKGPTLTGTSNKVKSKPTTFDIVHEAIKSADVPSKGISLQAIKQYVHGKSETDPTRLNGLIRAALLKGIEKGIFAKKKHFGKEDKGITGFFVLVKAKPKSSKDEDKIEVQKLTKATIKKSPSKQRKRNITSSLEDVEKSSAAKSTKSQLVKEKTNKPNKDSVEENVHSKKKTKTIDSKDDKAELPKKKTKAVNSKAEKPGLPKPKTKAVNPKAEKPGLPKQKTKAVTSKTDKPDPPKKKQTADSKAEKSDQPKKKTKTVVKE